MKLSGRDANESVLCLHPHVAVTHRITVVLQVSRTGRCRSFAIAFPRRCVALRSGRAPRGFEPTGKRTCDRTLGFAVEAKKETRSVRRTRSRSDIFFENLTVFLQPSLRLVHRRDLASDNVPESRRVVGLEQVG